MRCMYLVCVVSCYWTINFLKNNCWNAASPIYIFWPLPLKNLIIISKEKYLFQSTLFIGTWNLWNSNSYPGRFFVLKRCYIRGCWNCRVWPSSLTKTVHCCPKKMLISIKFMVHKLTYLEKLDPFEVWWRHCGLWHPLSRKPYIVPKETLISIELGFQRYTGWNAKHFPAEKCWRQQPRDYTKCLC